MAVTIDAAALALGAHIDLTAATRLLPVASAMVLWYAPAAPDQIANEATIRTAGNLAFNPPDPVRESEAGGLRVSRAASMTGTLSSSGSMGLLAPWRRRRAL